MTILLHALKRVLIFLAYLLLLLAGTEIFLRAFKYRPAHEGDLKYIPLVQPDSFMIPNSYLGWTLSSGVFTFKSGTETIFTATNNPYRITRPDSFNITNKKIINLYGCSYTYGQAVEDSSTFAYLLQLQNDTYEINNKGVPGYGLLQMFLTLQLDVSEGRGPAIAVFNYASFQNQRTILTRDWTNQLKWSIKTANASDFSAVSYPFVSYSSEVDTIQIGYLPWQFWPADFPLREKLALINLFNSAYNNVLDHTKKQTEEEAIRMLVRNIAGYCKASKIELIFYCFTDIPPLTLKALQDMGITTRISTVNVALPEFNKAPLDPYHPSEKAHKIYASELNACIQTVVNRH